MTHRVRRASKRDQQREATQQRVYGAALAIFRRDGVADARIEDIAALAGVSRATFYFHFPTKDLVLLEHLRQSESRTAVLLDALPEDASMDDVLGTVRKSVAEEWRSDPELFAEVGIVGLRVNVPSRGELMTERRDASPLRISLSRRLRALQTSGGFDSPIPAELLADLFLFNIFAATFTWSGHQAIPLDLVLEHVTALLLRGVRRDPS